MGNTMGKKMPVGRESFSEKIRSWTANIYLLIMLAVYPLFMVNGYMDLVYKKWAMFLYTTGVMVLFSVLWYLFGTKGNEKAIWFPWYLAGKAGRVKKDRESTWLPMDWFVIGYFICVIVSYLGASDRAFSLWGVDTWYTGFVSQMLFVGIYFMISTGYKKMPYLDVIAAAAGTLVAFIIVLQRFGVDAFSLYKGFGEDVKLNFVTTLGQVTWTSSYISILLIVGMGVYFAGAEGQKRVLWAVCIGIGFMAELLLNCDSGIIAIIAALMIMVWLAVGNREKTMRFMEVIMFLLAAAAVTGILERILEGQMVPIDAVYLKVAQSILIYPALALAAFLYWLVKTDKICLDGKRKAVWIIKGIYLALIGIAVIAAIVLFILHGKGYFSGSPTENYFRFTIWWGNSRGFIWRTGAAVFGDFGLWRKLFGCGPDGFTPYAYQLMGDAINEFWHNQLVPNVHNEWFNAVINYGLVGGIAYLGIFLSSAWACMKAAFCMEGEKKVVVFGCGLAAAGYIFHNVLCYQQIIGTPFIFILMGIGAAKIRWDRRKK